MSGSGITHKTTKGYLRITAGPLRNHYLHRVVAAAWLGRELTQDEEVHHRDGDKLNPHFSNLIIRGTKDHSWISTKQAYFMRVKDEREKAEWDRFMEEEDRKQQEEIRLAKQMGREWWPEPDGTLKRRWEDKYASASGV